jgi:hypothetical protein
MAKRLRSAESASGLILPNSPTALPIDKVRGILRVADGTIKQAAFAAWLRAHG